MSRTIVIIQVLLLVGIHAPGQESYVRPQVALMNTSYNGEVPEGINIREALSFVDGLLMRELSDLDRFTVISIPSRVPLDNEDEFIETIKRLRESNTELPESVLIGREAFTEADFNQIVGAFVVVIPTVTLRLLQATNPETGQTMYTVAVDVGVLFVNVVDMERIGRMAIPSQATSDSFAAALDEALASTPEFTTRLQEIMPVWSAVLAITPLGSEVTIAGGRDLGVRRGDEYRMFPEGRIVVRQVYEEVSIGRILYGNPVEGAEIREVPRFVFTPTTYAQLTITDTEVGGSFVLAAGARLIYVENLYRVRPMGGVEISVAPPPVAAGATEGGLSFSFTFGGDAVFYLARRFRIRPGILLVGTLSAKETGQDNEFEYTHFGYRALVDFNFLRFPNREISLGLGYTFMRGRESALDYTGVIVGIGATYKIGASSSFR